MSSQPAGDQRRTYAEWFVWARRNLTSTVEICHACAQAATAALSAGQPPAPAARHAAQNRVGAGWTSRAPDSVRAYAEWYDWSRTHLGLSGEPLHAATATALAALESGASSAVAAQAAREHAARTGQGTDPGGQAAEARAEATPGGPPSPGPPQPLPQAPPASSSVATGAASAPTSFVHQAMPRGAVPEQPIGAAPAPESTVTVPLWATILLGIGCAASLGLAVIYVLVLTMTTDRSATIGAGYLLSVGALAFLASLVALILIIRRAASARVVTIVAGFSFCLSCIGLLIGVPVIVGAVVARREAR